jgi:hypothetical protein
MAKYRSASHHVLGCEQAGPADVPHLPGLADVTATAETHAKCDAVATRRAAEENDPAVGPTQHALARPRGRRSVAPAWLAGGAAALALLGLLAWGSHDAFGARSSQAFPCPPGTTSAVQAATGCAVPQQAPIDGEDEE